MADNEQTTAAAPESQLKQQFNELGKIRREFTKDQIAFVMKTIFPTLNENETWLVMLKAGKLGLNPLLGEITAYSSINDRGERQLVIIDTRNGKRASAYRRHLIKKIETKPIYVKKIQMLDDQKKPIPGQFTTIQVEPWDGELWGATSSVWRVDSDEPFTVTVPLKEYNRGNKIWQAKPETMIKKVAESQALSAAIPDMSGIYDEAEDWREATPPALKAPEMADGANPATEDQLKTLKTLGFTQADLDSMNLTKQEAANLIIEKAQAKKAAKAEKAEAAEEVKE